MLLKKEEKEKGRDYPLMEYECGCESKDFHLLSDGTVECSKCKEIKVDIKLK